MKKYKITASQTIYATYEIEVEADNEKQAEKKALATSINDWDDERFENGDALDVDEIEEGVLLLFPLDDSNGVTDMVVTAFNPVRTSVSDTVMVTVFAVNDDTGA